MAACGRVTSQGASREGRSGGGDASRKWSPGGAAGGERAEAASVQRAASAAGARGDGGAGAGLAGECGRPAAVRLRREEGADGRQLRAGPRRAARPGGKVGSRKH